MKLNITFLFFIALSWSGPGYANEDKNPVAEDDFVSAKVMQTIEILVLKNDYAFDSHPFEIQTAVGGSMGAFLKTDSSFIYTSDLSIPTHLAIDSIIYNIVDLENGLVSNFAKVYIQITNEGFEMLHVNQVSCRINAYGLQFWDPNVNLYYEVPAGTGTSSIFSQSLWIGGLDEAGDLFLSSERYRIAGPDFYSGPVMDSSAYSAEQDVRWHKAWELSEQEVEYHRQHWQDPGYEPVGNIEQWPGNGDTMLGQANRLAFYYDRDSDGKYNAKKGDFPIIKGDQAILVINNDDRGPHLESGGKKLGIENQTLYYAYEAENDSALKYTTFADQYIINRSPRKYHDVYVGHFMDFDLGYFFDDFLHGDTSLESGICYNGALADGQGITGEYGEHPPAQSFTCLNYHMDGFVYFFSWGAPQSMQDPVNDKDYYNYLRGYWKDSTNFTYGGNGYGGASPVKHVFTGDPVSGAGWTEQDSPFGPGDRRALISSGPYVFYPGDTIHLEYAFVFARDPAGTNLSSLDLLENRILQVREFYQHSLGITDADGKELLMDIYPNPCRTDLFIKMGKFGQDESFTYYVFDVVGKLVRQGLLSNAEQMRIDIRDILPGIYIVRLINDQVSVTGKFIREDF